MIVVCMMMNIVQAAPHPVHHQMHRPNVRPAPPHLHHPINHYSYHTHHHSSWGHGGSYFWPGFIGGIIGSTISYSQPTVIKLAPVIVQPIVTPQPVIQPIQIWVEDRYVDQIQPNGTIIRVWQPGHYEVR